MEEKRKHFPHSKCDAIEPTFDILHPSKDGLVPFFFLWCKFVAKASLFPRPNFFYFGRIVGAVACIAQAWRHFGNVTGNTGFG